MAGEVVGAAVGAAPSPRPAAQQRWWCCVGWAWGMDARSVSGQGRKHQALPIGAGPCARALC